MTLERDEMFNRSHTTFLLRNEKGFAIQTRYGYYQGQNDGERDISGTLVTALIFETEEEANKVINWALDAVDAGRVVKVRRFIEAELL